MPNLPSIDEFRDFFVNDYEQVASEIERTDVIPSGILARAAELGAYRLTIPQEFGGFGLSVIDYLALPGGRRTGPGFRPHARPPHQRHLAPPRRLRN